MKMKNKIFGLIFTACLVSFAALTALAQEPVEVENKNPRRAARPFKIMQELGLSREQVQQIRRINQSRRPIMQDAARRWQNARQNLDEAIYADNISEEQVKELTRAAQVAQSELLKERTLTEFLIRNILTPDQLIKFRQLRAQLKERVTNPGEVNNPDNLDADELRPFNRFQRRKRNRRQ